MKFLTNAKLNPKQLRAVELTEHILNSFEFEAWFISRRFGDMVNPPNLLNVEVVSQIFNRQQYRFTWTVIKRGWFKKWLDKKSTGAVVANVISTYEDYFDTVTMPELCGYFARQMMHIVGFDEVDETVPNKSVPYMVGEYVYASACRLCKMNE
jgi:hypothetical protein